MLSLLLVPVVAFSAWTAAALWFQTLRRPVMRWLGVVLWTAFSIAVLISLAHGPRLLAAAAFLGACACVLLWWYSLRPSNDRPWADDVANIVNGQITGDEAVLHNVRNFSWRSASHYTARWETRHYDLRQLDSLDMIMSYWNVPGIAHVLFSFGFAGGERVAFSVEIRRQKHQAYSPVGGFFKEFELSIVAADERDIVRVRTNVRGEDDYLYRLRLPRPAIRSLFAAYVEQSNTLLSTPRFYNTLTINCTMLVYHMMRHIVGRLPFSYRVLLSGYLPEYVYSVGGLDMRFSLPELRAFGHITARAKAADDDPRFSAAIRAGIPPLDAQ
jgi:Domain of unknown function (DUF4105)